MATVPGGDVEVSVGTELKLSAVMLGVFQMRNGQDDQLGGGIRDVPIARRHGEARDADVPTWIRDRIGVGDRIEDVEVTVRGIVRIERDAGQALLAECSDAVT